MGEWSNEEGAHEHDETLDNDEVQGWEMAAHLEEWLVCLLDNLYLKKLTYVIVILIAIRVWRSETASASVFE